MHLPAGIVAKSSFSYMAGRNWLLTYYGTKLDFDSGLSAGESFIRGAIYQQERCPDTGRLHLQAYLETQRPVRLTALSKLWPGIHAERRLGTRQQAIDYCTKEKSKVSGPFTFGSMELNQGKRSDLDEIKEAMKEGCTELEIADEYFGEWVRYNKAFTRYRTLICPPRNFKTKLIIYWGAAGSGKTRKVYSEGGNVYPVPQPNGGNVWFDGLENQESVLLDDFYGWIPLSLLLKMADRYTMQVPVKGGMVNFAPKNLYITSNSHPNEWYKWGEMNSNLRAAFDRRIDEIVEF